LKTKYLGKNAKDGQFALFPAAVECPAFRQDCTTLLFVVDL